MVFGGVVGWWWVVGGWSYCVVCGGVFLMLVVVGVVIASLVSLDVLDITAVLFYSSTPPFTLFYPFNFHIPCLIRNVRRARRRGGGLVVYDDRQECFLHRNSLKLSYVPHSTFISYRARKLHTPFE